MAFGNTFYGEPCAFEGSVFLYGFNGVLAAGGGESACRREHRGDSSLIETDKEDEKFRHNQLFWIFSATLRRSDFIFRSMRA